MIFAKFTKIAKIAKFAKSWLVGHCLSLSVVMRKIAHLAIFRNITV